MNLKLFTADGSSFKEVDFPQLPNFEGTKGQQALKETLVAIAANRRLGTHSTKTRGEVSGGGKKPWRQKGTGRARAGSTRSPIWVGGGVVFGPKPRSYAKKVNTKVKKLAFARAVSDRIKEGDVILIEQFSSSLEKTKQLDLVLNKIYSSGKLLIVDKAFPEAITRSACNLDRVSLQEVNELNVVDVCQHGAILLSLEAFNLVLARIS